MVEILKVKVVETIALLYHYETFILAGDNRKHFIKQVLESVVAVTGLKRSGKIRNNNITIKSLFEHLMENHLIEGSTECTKEDKM